MIRDGANCFQSIPFVINSTTGPSISTINRTDVTCHLGGDGRIVVNAVGGTGGLQYSIGGPFQSSNTFNGLMAGTYTVTVRDAVGCIASSSAVLNQGNPIIVNATVANNVSCHNGSNGTVNLTASGGIGSLAYSVDGSVYQSLGNFTGLPAGSYLASVRDAGGCMGFNSFQITQPTPIVAGLGLVNVSCANGNNGSIFVTASGGTGALQYSLGGSSFSSTNSWNNLFAADYNVYVRDANNCMVQLFAVVNEPMPYGISAAVSNVSCADGDNGLINLNLSGGTQPYAFAWSNGAVIEDVFNLEAGNYTVTISDANNCTLTRTYSVTEPATPLTANGVSTGASSNTATDGGVDLNVTGGTAPYRFEWSNGATTEDLTNVSPNFYLVVVTDANGCQTTGIFSVGISTAIENAENSTANIRLFPNPAREQVMVQVEGFQTDMIESVNVVDALGRQLFTVRGNSNSLQINTADLAPGLYLLQIEVDGQRYTQKLQVVK